MNREARVHLKVETDEVVACGISDRGKVRPENEDAIWLDDSGTFMLLADGMGGHERGAEASKTTIAVISERLNPDAVRDQLSDITALAGVPAQIARLFPIIDDAVERASSEIYDRNIQLELERYMGTTLVGLLLVDADFVVWFHVGDSRLYRWRKGSLELLTTDHSAYEEWVTEGRVGKEPEKNIITRAVGPNPFVQADTSWGKRERNDIYVLCSDGLSDMVTDEHITEILREETEVDVITRRFVDAALDAGGKDNTSVIVCKI
jgi:protein phosphatase